MSTITVRVLRSPQEEGGKSEYQAFEVETYPRMSVLDALFQIQREKDRSISFRCSCRLGMCGTCAIIINNREGLACQTQISRLNTDEISLRPMNYLPVVKDLAVDMEPFFDRYRAVKPYFVPNETSRDALAAGETQVIKQAEASRKWVDPALGCITCGICYSSCSVVGFNAEFPGPAALNRAYTLTNDVRDGARDERLAVVGGAEGVWRCHQLFNCANACPRHLVPTQAIRQLRVEAGSTSPNPLAAPLRWLKTISAHGSSPAEATAAARGTAPLAAARTGDPEAKGIPGDARGGAPAGVRGEAPSTNDSPSPSEGEGARG